MLFMRWVMRDMPGTMKLTQRPVHDDSHNRPLTTAPAGEFPVTRVATWKAVMNDPLGPAEARRHRRDSPHTREFRDVARVKWWKRGATSLRDLADVPNS